MTGGMEDLSSAIEVTEEALKIFPGENSERAAWLDNLGNLSRKHIELEHEKISTWPSNLVKHLLARHHFAILVELVCWPTRGKGIFIPVTLLKFLGNPWLLHLLIKSIDLFVFESLAGCFGARYQRTADMEDLNNAIGIFRENVQAVSSDYPSRAQWLGNLATYLIWRQERNKTHDPKLAEEFISLREELDASTSRRTVLSVDEIGTSHTLQPRTQGRLTAEDRLQDVLQSIRSESGSASFLLLPTQDELIEYMSSEWFSKYIQYLNIYKEL